MKITVEEENDILGNNFIYPNRLLQNIISAYFVNTIDLGHCHCVEIIINNPVDL
jgi:hypothetical protein